MDCTVIHNFSYRELYDSTNTKPLNFKGKISLFYTQNTLFPVLFVYVSVLCTRNTTVHVDLQPIFL